MENSKDNRTRDTLCNFLLQDNPNANIGLSERMISTGTGAFIAIKGVSNIFSSPRLALIELGIGGLLLYRGITGYCPITATLENGTMIIKQELEGQRVSGAKSINFPTGSTGDEGWTGMI